MKSYKKAAVFTLIFALLALSIIIAVPSPKMTEQVLAATDNLWTSHKDINWEAKINENVGDITDPYEISTAEELAAFADSVNNGNTFSGKYIRLTADINLDGYYWVPIGCCNDNSGATESQNRPFLGTFDAGKYNTAGEVVGAYTIKNMKIDTSVSEYTEYRTNLGLNYNTSTALFGFVGSADSNTAVVPVGENFIQGEEFSRFVILGVVKNLYLTDAKVTSSYAYVGGVVATSSGLVNNCYLTGDSTITCTNTLSGKGTAGGIVAHNRIGSIFNCFNFADVSSNYTAGGICGWTENSTFIGDASASQKTNLIKECINYGKISASIVGGVCGNSDGMVSNNKNQQTEFRAVGNEENAVVTLIADTGTSMLFAGGIIGSGVSGQLVAGYNAGTIVSTVTNRSLCMGGLYGKCGGAISASYNYGNVIYPSSALSGSYFGCIVGNLIANSTPLENSHSYYVAGTLPDTYDSSICTVATTAAGNKADAQIQIGGSGEPYMRPKTKYELFSYDPIGFFNWNKIINSYGVCYWYFDNKIPDIGNRPILAISLAYADINATSSTEIFDGNNKTFSVDIVPSTFYENDNGQTQTLYDYDFVYYVQIYKKVNGNYVQQKLADEKYFEMVEGDDFSNSLIKDAGQYRLVFYADGWAYATTDTAHETDIHTFRYFYTEYDFEIKKRQVTVTVPSQIITYGDSAPSVYTENAIPETFNEITNTGILSADVAKVNTGVKLLDNSGITSGYITVGTYRYSLSNLTYDNNNNYILVAPDDETKNTLTVNKKNLSLVYVGALSIEYGTNPSVYLADVTNANNYFTLGGTVGDDIVTISSLETEIDDNILKSYYEGAERTIPVNWNGTQIETYVDALQLIGITLSNSKNYKIDNTSYAIDLIVNPAKLTITSTEDYAQIIKSDGVILDFDSIASGETTYKYIDKCVVSGFKFEQDNWAAAGYNVQFSATATADNTIYDGTLASAPAFNTLNKRITYSIKVNSFLSSNDYYTKNYTLNTTNEVGTLIIKKHVLTFNKNSLSVNDKVYDGTATAICKALTTDNFSGWNSDWGEPADTITILGISFNDVNVGDNKTVTIVLQAAYNAEFELEGTYMNCATTASITKREVTVSLADTNKTYGDSDNYSLYKLSYSNLTGDGASIMKTELDAALIRDGIFTREEGEDYIESGYEISIVGGYAALINVESGISNYKLSVSEESSVFMINKKRIATPVFLAASKEYDGNNEIELNFASDAETIFKNALLTEDKNHVFYTTNETEKLLNSDVGSQICEVIFTLYGDRAFNYELSNAIVNVTAEITPRNVELRFERADYSGNYAMEYGETFNPSDYEYNFIYTGTSDPDDTLVAQQAMLRNNIKVICLKDSNEHTGKLSVGSYILSCVPKGNDASWSTNMSNYNVTVSTSALQVVVCTKELPMFSDTDESVSYTYGQNFSVPIASIGVVELVATATENEYCTYAYSYFLGNKEISLNKMLNAGTYTLKCTVTTKDGYQFKSASGTPITNYVATFGIVIEKKELYLSVNDMTITQGDELPDFSKVTPSALKAYGYADKEKTIKDAGYVYSDTYTALKGSISVSASNDLKHTVYVGSYYLVLNIDNLSADNYTLKLGTGDSRGKLIIVAKENATRIGADGIVRVGNVVDDDVSVGVDLLNAKDYKSFVNDASIASVYNVSITKDGESFSTGNVYKMYLYIVQPSDYSSISVVRVNDEGKLDSKSWTIIGDNTDTITLNNNGAEVTYIKIDITEGGTYIVTGIAKSSGFGSKLYYVIGGGALLIVIATILAIALVRRAEKQNAGVLLASTDTVELPFSMGTDVATDADGKSEISDKKNKNNKDENDDDDDFGTPPPTPQKPTPTSPVKAQPQQTVRPTQPQQTVRPAQPQQTVRPAQPQQAVRPAQPQQNARPAQPQQVVRPTQPQQVVRPAYNQNQQYVSYSDYDACAQPQQAQPQQTPMSQNMQRHAAQAQQSQQSQQGYGQQYGYAQQQPPQYGYGGQQELTAEQRAEMLRRAQQRQNPNMKDAKK